MASLTSNEPGLDSGKRIIQPAQQTSGFLDGLARAADGALGAFSANRASADKLAGEKALNDTERGVTNLRVQAEQSIRAPIADRPLVDFMGIGNMAEGDAPPLPTDLALQKQAIDKTQRGIAQGKTAVAQLNLQLEQFQQTIETQYPDQAAKIGSYMHSQGYDHYMWRDTNDAAAAHESDQSAMNSGRAAVIDAAQKMGVNPNGDMSPDDLFHTGSDLLAAKALAEQLKLRQEQALASRANQRAETELGFKQHDFDQKQVDATANDYAQATVTATLGPVYRSLTGLLESAGDSEDFAAHFEKVNGSATTFANNFKNHLRNDLANRHVSQEVIDKAMAGVDDQTKAFNDLVSGSTSQVAQKKRMLDLMQTNWGLKLDKALVVSKYLRDTLGNGWADGSFGVDPTKLLPEDIKNKVASELQNFDPTKPNQGFHLLQDVGALVKGDASLADKPPGYWTANHIHQLTVAASGSAKRVIDPKVGTSTDRSDFLNSQSNVVMAATSFTVGNKDFNAQNFAIHAITAAENVGALDTLMKGTTSAPQAKTLFLASRAAAANVLEAARSSIPNTPGQGLVIKNGRWIVKASAPTEGMIPLMDESGMSSLPQNNRATTDPRLVLAADTMNQAVDFLVHTAKVDPKHAGVDDVTLRAHLMTGTPLPVKEGEKTQKVDWEAHASALEAELNARGKELDTKMPLQSYNPDRTKYQPMAEAEADKLGLKPEAARWLFQNENGWRAEGGTQILDEKGKPKSSARGIGQFTEDTAKQYGLIHDGIDERENPEKAIPAALRYLSDLVHKHKGDYVAAFKDYGTLHRSNHKAGPEGDAEYAQKIASLQNALGGQ